MNPVVLRGSSVRTSALATSAYMLSVVPSADSSPGSTGRTSTPGPGSAPPPDHGPRPVGGDLRGQVSARVDLRRVGDDRIAIAGRKLKCHVPSGCTGWPR